jgi:hypothetical protein
MKLSIANFVDSCWEVGGISIARISEFLLQKVGGTFLCGKLWTRVGWWNFHYENLWIPAVKINGTFHCDNLWMRAGKLVELPLREFVDSCLEKFVELSIATICGCVLESWWDFHCENLWIPVGKSWWNFPLRKVMDSCWKVTSLRNFVNYCCKFGA